MELSFDPITIELNLHRCFFPWVNMLCSLEATSGLLVNHMKTSGMMLMKKTRPFKWDRNCEEDRETIKPAFRDSARQRSIPYPSVGNHLKAYLAPPRLCCGNAVTDVKLSPSISTVFT